MNADVHVKHSLQNFNAFTEQTFTTVRQHQQNKQEFLQS